PVSTHPAQWRQPIGLIESSRPCSSWTKNPRCFGKRSDSRGSSRKADVVSEIFRMRTYPIYLNGDLTVTERFCTVKNPATGEAFARMSVVGRPMVAQALQD